MQRKSYSWFSAVHELMFAGIGPSRLLLARFLKTYEMSHQVNFLWVIKKKDDQWRGLESHTSNNWLSFPSSDGILPESWLSFNCLQCRKRLQPLYLQSQKILSEKQETMNRLTLPSILQVAELWHVAEFGRNRSSELVPMQIPAQRSNGSK